MPNKSEFESNFQKCHQSYKAYFFFNIQKVNGIHSTVVVTAKFQSMVQQKSPSTR